MHLNEEYGLVTNEEHSFMPLVQTIVEYIFDIQDGLNADPFYDPKEGSVITLKNITSYAKYVNKKISAGQQLIPSWISNFNISILPNAMSNAYLNNIVFKDGKVSFDITVGDKTLKSETSFTEDLLHEFRHAYQKWVKLNKGLKTQSDKSKDVYSAFTKLYNNETVPKILDFFIDEYYLDGVVLSDGSFTDKDMIENIIKYSFYLTDAEESVAYRENFSTRLAEILKKRDFHYDGQLLNDLDFSQFSVPIYRVYAGYLQFWKNTNKIDNKLKEEVCEDLKDIMDKAGFSASDSKTAFDKMTRYMILNLSKAISSFNKIFANVVRLS